MKSPADYGGIKSADYLAINPEGKIPALILPTGETLFEAKVIMGYLLDVYGHKFFWEGPEFFYNSGEGAAFKVFEYDA